MEIEEGDKGRVSGGEREREGEREERKNENERERERESLKDFRTILSSH